MNTSKKVDSKGLDSLAVKLKDANFAEWNAGDLKSVLREMKLKVARRNEVGASRSSASDQNLWEKRLKGVKRIYVFQTSMDPTEIPPPSSVWSTEQSFFPQVDATTISQYTGFKRIFNSSKIKTVKVHRNGEVTFVKAKDQSSGCTRIQKRFP